MEVLTAKAALVDPLAFSGDGAALETSIPRSEAEAALQADEAMDLYLDIAGAHDGRVRSEETRRIIVSWEHDDLERLLQSSTGHDLTLVFSQDELRQVFDSPDVEGHGLRGKAAVLSVAAATAAGIYAGGAAAMTANDPDSSAPPAVTAFVTDATSSGPAAVAPSVAPFVTDTTSSGPSTVADVSGTPAFVTDTTSSGPSEVAQASSGVTKLISDAASGGYTAPAEAAAASDSSDFVSTTGGEAALGGGIALLIAAAGFVATRQRHTPRPA